MTRRRFVFWIGFGLFSLAEKLRAASLDKLAAVAMGAAKSTDALSTSTTPVHWTAAENKTFRWYERENFTNGQWKLTGITTPVHKKTGQLHIGDGYLNESLVPAGLRRRDASKPESERATDSKLVEMNGLVEASPGEKPPEQERPQLYADHRPTAKRRARHGRPPSKWLRSLNADEIRIWLNTIEVPEAGVSGMTYWTHLTRDHSFDAEKIEGLSEEEQAKLHAAAHYGY